MSPAIASSTAPASREAVVVAEAEETRPVMSQRYSPEPEVIQLRPVKALA